MRLTYDNHNVPLLPYKPIKPNKSNKYSKKLSNINRNPNFGTKYFARKFSREMMYYMLDSDKAPTWDINYIKGSSNQLAQSVARRTILKQTAKFYGKITKKLK